MQGVLAALPAAALARHADGQTTHPSEQPVNRDNLGGRSVPAASQPARDDYHPAFFTQAEWHFLNAACDCLIPPDHIGPGAVQAGVPQYIDRQMATPWAAGAEWYMQAPFFDAKPEFGYQSRLTPRQQYRLGIRAIDQACRQEAGSPFADMPAEHQVDILRRIESGAITSPDLSLRLFFTSFLLANTREGYFCDPMYGGNRGMEAWAMIGHPGARADYLDWVGRDGPYPYGPVDIHGDDA
ncbi:gluconate 2-dehydrogenase subunit 3 family protein [Gluconacetobacter tumulisoli]|uniref:gluconate 2-dehydrogenase subunit 3 family protein n=1 Tax=Gluconacetobacter tumulisoli TaxID=1286189 RepID=UPI001C810B46|nr:gluconate 2-dehydrogenase subunit 3 family protein [Gluconacetobacter tumulisoli]